MILRLCRLIPRFREFFWIGRRLQEITQNPCLILAVTVKKFIPQSDL